MSGTQAAKEAAVTSFFDNPGNLHDLNELYNYEEVMKLLVALTEAGFKFHLQSEFTKRVLLRIAVLAASVPPAVVPAFLHTVTTLLNLSVTPLVTQRVLQGRVRDVVGLIDKLHSTEGLSEADAVLNNSIQPDARSKVELRDFYMRNVFGKSYESMAIACRREDRDQHDWEQAKIKYNDIVPPAVAEELDRLEERYPDERRAFDNFSDSDDEENDPAKQFKRELQELKLGVRELNFYDDDEEAKAADEQGYQFYKKSFGVLEAAVNEVTDEHVKQFERQMKEREMSHPDAKTDKTLFAEVHELDQHGLAEEMFFGDVEHNTLVKSKEEWQAVLDEVNALRNKRPEKLTPQDELRIKQLYEQVIVAGRPKANQLEGEAAAKAEAEGDDDRIDRFVVSESEEKEAAEKQAYLLGDDDDDGMESNAMLVEALKARASGVVADLRPEVVKEEEEEVLSDRKKDRQGWDHHTGATNLTVPFRRPAGSADFVDRDGRDSFTMGEIKNQFGRAVDEDKLVERLLEGRDESVFADPRENEDACYYLTDDEEEGAASANVHQQLGVFLHASERVAFAQPVDRAHCEASLGVMTEQLRTTGKLAGFTAHSVFDTTVAMLGQRVVNVRDRLSPADMLTTLQALVLFVYPDVEVTTDIVRRLVASGDRLSYAQTADLLAAVASVPFLKTPGDWAFGSLDNWSATLAGLSARLSGAGLSGAPAESIALATYAFGQMLFRPAERKLVAICQEMSRNAGSVDGNTAALFLSGMKALKFSPPPELIDALLEAAVRDVQQLSFSDVTAVVSALASSHYEVLLTSANLVDPLLERAGRTFTSETSSQLVEEFSAACRSLGVLPPVNLELPFLQATLSNQSDIERLTVPQRHLKNLIWEKRLGTDEDYVRRLQEYTSQASQ